MLEQSKLCCVCYKWRWRRLNYGGFDEEEDQHYVCQALDSRDNEELSLQESVQHKEVPTNYYSDDDESDSFLDMVEAENTKNFVN